MHPSKFFEETRCIDEIGCVDMVAQQELKEMHPRNFLMSSVSLPVYEITVQYETNRGNVKVAKKFCVLDSAATDSRDSLDYYAEVAVERAVQMFNKSNPGKELNNYKILAVEKQSTAVLTIG